MTDTPRHDSSIELNAGTLRLALRADLGGCIAGLWHGRTPILRSTDAAQLTTSRKSACYPLVPYSNRLAYMRFSFEGRDYTTQPNFDENPHSVHGVGWLRPWDMLSHGTTDATLRYVHTPDAHWPFAFEATQRFALTPQSLSVQMEIINRADIHQPVGLGWHPYFQKRASSRLRIAVTDRWESGADELPTVRVPQAGIDGDVSQFDFDHCFDGWHGPARIADEEFSMQLTSSLSRLVIYTPHDKDYYCVEPVSHVSDAIHMTDPAAHGLRTLSPGERFEASMTLDITALAS